MTSAKDELLKGLNSLEIFVYNLKILSGNLPLPKNHSQTHLGSTCAASGGHN